MAIADSTAVTMTAACEVFGRHANHQGPGACRGTVLSFTPANLTDCQCGCHAPEPIEEEELERLADLEADRRLSDVGVWS